MNIIEYTNKDITIDQEWIIQSEEMLVLKNCTLQFNPGTGIFSTGKIEAEDCTFLPADPKAGWKGIADISKGRSSFRQCTFIGGRGRPLGELKDHYVSRYFGELDDLEIIEEWSEYDTEAITNDYGGTHGGALIALNSSVIECVFVGCRVSEDGGAMMALFNVDIDHCRFKNCRAGVDGGALVMKSHGSLSNSLFLSCRARDEGGAVLCDDTVTIKRCHFKKCVARIGGGISTHAKAHINDCAFISCIATNSGGGLSGIVSARHLVFRQCSSKTGGGADLENGSTLTNSLFHRCHAKDEGGGLWSFAHELSSIERCKFIQCSAHSTGGGARVGRTIMRHCIWKNNVITTSKPDEMSADHLYASGGSIIQFSDFQGCRYEEEGVLQFVLFESTLLQCVYCEEHIDPNFPVVRATIIPKTLDWFQTTPFVCDDIRYMAISNGLPTIAIGQKGTRYADRVLATLSDKEKSIEILDSKGVLSKEEKKRVRHFIATNYQALMDHYFCKTSSNGLLNAIKLL